MLEDLIAARIRSNALYSMYKEARDNEDRLYSMAAEQITYDKKLDEEKVQSLIRDIKKLIDKA